LKGRTETKHKNISLKLLAVALAGFMVSGAWAEGNNKGAEI